MTGSVDIESRDRGIWSCRSAEGVHFVVARDPDPPADYAARPANGGIRIKGYGSDEECLREARALALRMTEKQALYNVGLAGVKIAVRADPKVVDKLALMAAIAQVLHQLDGSVYTGSDLNVTAEDIAFLGELCPYVLAGLGTGIDPSVATAHGVLGALMATLGVEALPATSFLVHGIGKVGSVVASELVRRGAGVVRAIDRETHRTRLPGLIDHSHVERWWAEPVDVLVLCSDSYAIDSFQARDLRCRLIVGSANLPFEEQEHVCHVLRDRGIQFLPDQVTSAGATICDSIEFYRPDVFQRAEPADVYSFVHSLVRRTTARLLRLSQPIDPLVIDPEVMREETLRALAQPICGEQYGDWIRTPDDEVHAAPLGLPR